MDSATREPGSFGERLTVVVDTYWPPLKTSLIQQVVLCVIESLLLTADSPLPLVLVLELSYWAMLTLIVCRRPISPTKIDLLMVRYGFLFIYFFVGIAATIQWLITGRPG